MLCGRLDTDSNTAIVRVLRTWNTSAGHLEGGGGDAATHSASKGCAQCATQGGGSGSEGSLG